MTAPAAKVPEKKPEKKFDTTPYSCEIVLEKTTVEKANDRQLPSDAFNVFYIVDGKEHLDVTRSEKMVNVFDLYYDRYGKGAVQKIDYGHGTVRPNLWGAKPPAKQKKRRKP
tara:strand:- start:2250 stop:2585 length:336 start_codon:yes stop_codon:yes gene_type:complete